MTLLGYLLAYLLGGIPFAYLVGRLHGLDIRRVGSGNVGTRNVLRTLGPAWGLLVLAGDVLKGALAVLLARALGDPLGGAGGGIAAVLGHCFSPYLGLSGGKGLAATLGVGLALGGWPFLLLWGAGYVGSGFVTGQSRRVAARVVAGWVLVGLLLTVLAWRGPWPAWPGVGAPRPMVAFVWGGLPAILHRHLPDLRQGR